MKLEYTLNMKCFKIKVYLTDKYTGMIFAVAKYYRWKVVHSAQWHIEIALAKTHTHKRHVYENEFFVQWKCAQLYDKLHAHQNREVLSKRERERER